MRKRIFIAINLPEEIKNKLAFYQEKIEELFTPYRNEVSGAGPCRWTKKQNLHITLIFLGYLTDEEIPELCKIAKEVSSKYSQFTVNLNKICYGPPKKMPPRMIWVQGKKSKILSDLKEDLEKSLTENIRPALSAKGRDREFSPHLTLGRIKTWQWRQIEPEDRPEVEEDISLSFNVNSIEVMESKLKRSGPEYTILESVELAQ